MFSKWNIRQLIGITIILSFTFTYIWFVRLNGRYSKHTNTQFSGILWTKRDTQKFVNDIGDLILPKRDVVILPKKDPDTTSKHIHLERTIRKYTTRLPITEGGEIPPSLLATNSHLQSVNETRKEVLSLRQRLRGLAEPNKNDMMKLKKNYPNAKVEKTSEIPFSQFKYPIDVDFQELVQKLKRKESSLEPINVYNYSYLLNPVQRCQGDVEMVYLIKSSPNNFVRRDSIRNTWANEPLMRNFSFRAVFLTALSKRIPVNSLVQWEAELHHDVLQIDYIDHYYNNTLKTTGGLKWAAENCGNARYAMFLDDDFYVNTYKMPTLLDYIDRGNHTYAFMGHVLSVAPIRDKRNKWYVSEQVYPYDKYPPFVSAGSWIVTKDLLQDMNLVIPYTKHYIFDDVFIAIVAYKLKVKPIVIKHFTMTKVSYRTEVFKVTLTSHGYDRSFDLSGAWNCTVAYTYNLTLPSYCFHAKKIPRKHKGVDIQKTPEKRIGVGIQKTPERRIGVDIQKTHEKHIGVEMRKRELREAEQRALMVHSILKKIRKRQEIFVKH